MGETCGILRSHLGSATEDAAAVSKQRWWVHLGLMVTTVVSLILEPILTVHIVLGLAFTVLVVVHLVQRRRIGATLARRLGALRGLARKPDRLAVADAMLTLFTLAMFISGIWDWVLGHPTRIRWHAITGVVLAGFLLVHTLRRWRRLRTSHIR